MVEKKFVRRFMARASFAIGILAIGVAGLFVLGLVLYPIVAQLHPTFQQLKKICGSIESGSSYESVEERHGAMFSQPPSTYIDSEGNGQIWIVSKGAPMGAGCHVELRAYKVIDAGVVYTWL